MAKNGDTTMAMEPVFGARTIPRRKTPLVQKLEFITQTGGKTSDPALKRKVRQHARYHVSRSKGVESRAPLLKFSLIVPDSFGSSSESSVYPTPDKRPFDTTISAPSHHQINNQVIRGYQTQSRLSSKISSQYTEVPQLGLESLGPNTSRGRSNERASRRPKVRTGCWTCNGDETNPACAQCMETLGRFTGYFQRLEPSPTQAIIPESYSSGITLYRPSHGLPFEDDTEALYFDIFRQETAVELSGVFKSSFWNQILLQESHRQPFVRKALAAIGALNKSGKTSHLTEIHPTSKSTSQQQREYALSMYGKSLRGMQLIPQGETQHLRDLVIAVLLVFMFETFQQQPDIAFSHALIGDRLMCHFVEMHPHSMPHNEGIASPATHIIETELLMTYCRLDTQMLTFVDVRSQYVHDMGKASCLSTVEQMPVTFGNLKDATFYWEVVMRRGGHFVSSAFSMNNSSIFAREFSRPFPGKTLEINAQTSIYGSPQTVPDILKQEHLQHLSEIDRWSSAFAPLLENLQQTPTDIQTSTALMLLRLYSLTFRIVIAGTTFREETKYDHFLPKFVEMVNLARMICNNLLEITHRQPAYHFHMSVVPTLFTVLLRCRDGVLRREAIEILRMSRYDGPWDRYMIAAVGKWIMELEEARAVDGVIPEEARVRLSRMSMSMERRGVMVQVVKMAESEDDLGLEWVETRLDRP